jgi:two-component system response regulator DevR
MKASNQRWRVSVRSESSAPHPRDVMSTSEPTPRAFAAPALDVVVADDSALVREHLVALLSTVDHVRVVGEAENTPELIGLIDVLHPRVVVLDISMPGGNGIKALQHIKQVYPETLVIMLTNHSNEFYRKKCLGAGASFFFDKTCEFEKVSDVLRGMAGAA